MRNTIQNKVSRVYFNSTNRKEYSRGRPSSRLQHLKVIGKYAFGETNNFPIQNGGDIENEVEKERVTLLARAIVSKIDPKTAFQPPPLTKSFEEAKNRPDFLYELNAHDEKLDRHRPKG